MPEYKYLPLEEIRQCIPGKLIKHKVTDTVYQITDNFGDRAVAVRIVDITNPSEWLILREDNTKDINPN